MNLARYGDSNGRCLLEFMLNAIRVHQRHVPPALLSDIQHISRELFMDSAFHTVRSVARELWLQFDNRSHLSFCQIFQCTSRSRDRRRCVLVASLGTGWVLVTLEKAKCHGLQLLYVLWSELP